MNDHRYHPNSVSGLWSQMLPAETGRLILTRAYESILEAEPLAGIDSGRYAAEYLMLGLSRIDELKDEAANRNIQGEIQIGLGWILGYADVVMIETYGDPYSTYAHPGLVPEMRIEGTKLATKVKHSIDLAREHVIAAFQTE